MGRFVVREYQINSPLISRDLTAVLLADLHSCVYGENNADLLSAIDRVNPDYVFCAGDMMIARPEKDDSIATDFMGRTAEKYPVYYSLGNHEYRLKLYPDEYGDRYEKYRTALKNAGISFLDNSSLNLSSEKYGDENIRVTGLSIDRKYYQRFKKIPMDTAYLYDTVGKPEPGKFQILLAHDPEYYDSYDAWGADLVLSGHVHGGVMRLPFLGGVVSPRLRLFPKYDGGEFQGKNGKMILSRGLGSHTIPVRIFNPAELVVMHLAKQKDYR